MWLFSRRVDLTVFLGAALFAFALLGVGWYMGILQDDAPTWIWLPSVVLIDVAHVWATAFRVYLDGPELQRRRWLYGAVPVVGYALGVALYSEGELVFWSVLAYVAVFHFVRQQYGWVMRYRARVGETDRFGYWLDTLTIYVATCYPLLHWHLHLPKRFQWFMQGDFKSLAWLGELGWLDDMGRVLFFALLAVYAARSARSRWKNPGKDIVVLCTAACWYVGIVVLNSDYAFTVTNVIIHGVPYFAIVYQYMTRRRREIRQSGAGWIFAPSLAVYLALLWSVAFGEEWLWDKVAWHDPEHRFLFGAGWEVGAWRLLLVPLLALPQLVHYVLDGFVWRRRQLGP